MFSKALLNGTYKNGRSGHLTDEHEKAENHRFKTEHLFKNKKIPKELYATRLIQHFLIIKALEIHLRNLSTSAKSEINAFFALSYLEDLWRSLGIEHDLQQLNVDPNNVSDDEIANSTTNYLKNIEKFPPKILLAHFLMHIAGFMHGGNIIRTKYIEPSNLLTSYQIPLEQYDFKNAFFSIGKNSPIGLYQDMIKEVDNIVLDENEYEEILEQCKSIYQTMADIYDDLCEMHFHQPIQFGHSFAVLGVSLFILAVFLKLMANFEYSMSIPTSQLPALGP